MNKTSKFSPEVRERAVRMVQEHLFARQVVGWSLQERMHTGLLKDALAMAWWRRRPPPGG